MALIDVKIKMYCHGLGDCFLLSFNYSDNNVSHVLFDCGVLLGTPNAEQKMKDVVNDISKQTNDKLDIVIATHEHWDHLSGFKQASDEFKNIKIGEVWMAWTEDLNDKFAKELKQKHQKVFDTIDFAYDKIKENPQFIESMTGFNAFFSFFGIERENEEISRRTINKIKINKTADAFELLKKHPESKNKYLDPGVVVENKRFGGVRFYILGPPKDERMLKKMNPSQKNKETYLGIGSDTLADNILMALDENSDIKSENYNPFGKMYGIDEQKVQIISSESNSQVTNLHHQYYNVKKSWQQIDKDWLNTVGSLAIQLDNSINNTSLVIAIELIDSGKFLLFPGDAQVGNWLSWKNYIWKVKEGEKEKEITIDSILAKTVLYKVSHHGSHNATLRQEGLEKMTSEELIAMIPVDKEMAEKKGWKMPYDDLRKEIEKKTISDNLIVADEKKDNKLYQEKIVSNK